MPPDLIRGEAPSAATHSEVAQGAALFLLYEAATQKAWPATDGEIFAPLLAVALFVPTVVVAARTKPP